jgi:hypothetical protein
MRKPISNTHNASNRARLTAGFAFSLLIAYSGAMGAQLPVDLGTAGNYVILAKSGISTVPTSAITGDIGVSPIDSTAITGFSLILDSSGQFSTSSQLTGKAYAPDYASPTSAKLTTAVSDMQTAYTDAAGRTLPDHTELGSGNIGGLTLAPGLYKWSTGLTIPTDVTLAGSQNDVWIFQIAGDVTIAGATSVILSGGAQARNIFWQVAGGVGVDLGTTSHFNGIILSQAGINLRTGASLNGRLLAQTAVTLEANIVISPTAQPAAPRFGPLARRADGTVTLVLTNTPGFLLTLEYSTNLMSWTPLSTVTPTTNPYVTHDSTTSVEARRFYRAFYP